MRCLVATIVLFTASAASAQTQEQRAEATEHFDSGLEHYDEGSFELAFIEFNAAYDLVPNYRLLYNIGNVQRSLGRPVEAVAAFERYLSEGGDDIARRRRREVEASLQQQRGRIGSLMVTTNVEGASIVVDDVDVATAPLSEPIPIAIGTHNVSVRAPGYDAPRRSVDIAGRSELRIEIELTETQLRQGSLFVTTIPAHDVEIRVDGEVVGMTPLADPIVVEAGTHQITVQRTGYVPQTVEREVEDGVAYPVEITLPMAPNARADTVGELRLRLPAASFTLDVDGERVDAREGLQLPIGRHEVLLEVEERRPHRETISIAAGSTVELAPELSWTALSGRDLTEAADLQRLYGIIVGGTSVGLFLTSAVFLIWNETRTGRRDELRAVWECTVTPGRECDMFAEELGFGRMQATQLASEYDSLDLWIPITRGFSIAGLAAGAIGLAIGGWLFFDAPTDEEIDAAASTPRVGLGPDGISVSGTF